jgi:hypothetical protein
MKARSLRLLVAAISPILLGILACSSPVVLFATATPTATNTPTVTLTPTATPVPIFLSSCVFYEDCPEAHLVTNYLATDLQTNVLTTVVIPSDDKIRLNTGWCTKDEATLQASLPFITYIFEINGVSYVQYATIKHGFWWGDDPSNHSPCVFIGAMLSGFHIGENQQVKIGYSFNAEVSDGWTTRAPFTDVYLLDLEPANIPTVTPTETPTQTPTSTSTPTNTPYPTWTIPYYTPTPSCSASSSLYISNTTGGLVTLYLSGPASFVFYLNSGDTTLSVCSGTYSYTAYGCGGATDTGSMSSGESHEFYCQ